VRYHRENTGTLDEWKAGSIDVIFRYHSEWYLMENDSTPLTIQHFLRHSIIQSHPIYPTKSRSSATSDWGANDNNHGEANGWNGGCSRSNIFGGRVWQSIT
jgi:hypothetical protein